MLTTKKIQISEQLILNLLAHGTAGCIPVRGVPKDAVIMAARFDAEHKAIELVIGSHEWRDEEEFFVPTFSAV